MKNFSYSSKLFLAVAAALLAALPVGAQEATVPVQMTVTASGIRGTAPPPVTRQDVMAYQDRERIEVKDWVPAQGEQAGLELVIVIDDNSDTSLGLQLADLREFINALPATASVGVAYASNGAISVAQNLTADKALAAKALRIPRGFPGAMSSPYLSVMDLISRWPESKNRREVLLITDGINRFRGGNPVDPDVDSLVEKAQRAGVLIHTLYATGVGRADRNLFRISLGQSNLAKLADQTGGEDYFQGYQTPIAFAPYLEQLRKTLNNQYILTVLAKPGKKAGLVRFRVTTELSGVELSAPDYSWVPAAQ
jgi:hypothetical protein